MNLSFFPLVILHILPPLFHAILSRIFAKLLVLEHGNGRKYGHAGSYHSADLYSCKHSYTLTDWLPKISFNYVAFDWNWLTGSKTLFGQRERDWQSNHKSRIILGKEGNKSAQVWLRSMCFLKSLFTSAQQKWITFNQIAF